MKDGSLVQQGEPLVSGATEIPVFNEELLVSAVGYEVDLEERKVSYFGLCGEKYVESYPKVEINNFLF